MGFRSWNWFLFTFTISRDLSTDEIFKAKIKILKLRSAQIQRIPWSYILMIQIWRFHKVFSLIVWIKSCKFLPFSGAWLFERQISLVMPSTLLISASLSLSFFLPSRITAEKYQRKNIQTLVKPQKIFNLVSGKRLS